MDNTYQPERSNSVTNISKEINELQKLINDSLPKTMKQKDLTDDLRLINDQLDNISKIKNKININKNKKFKFYSTNKKYKELQFEEEGFEYLELNIPLLFNKMNLLSIKERCTRYSRIYIGLIQIIPVYELEEYDNNLIFTYLEELPDNYVKIFCYNELFKKIQEYKNLPKEKIIKILIELFVELTYLFNDYISDIEKHFQDDIRSVYRSSATFPINNNKERFKYNEICIYLECIKNILNFIFSTKGKSDLCYIYFLNIFIEALVVISIVCFDDIFERFKDSDNFYSLLFEIIFNYLFKWNKYSINNKSKLNLQCFIILSIYYYGIKYRRKKINSLLIERFIESKYDIKIYEIVMKNPKYLLYFFKIFQIKIDIFNKNDYEKLDQINFFDFDFLSFKNLISTLNNLNKELKEKLNNLTENSILSDYKYKYILDNFLNDIKRKYMVYESAIYLFSSLTWKHKLFINYCTSYKYNIDQGIQNIYPPISILTIYNQMLNTENERCDISIEIIRAINKLIKYYGYQLKVEWNMIIEILLKIFKYDQYLIKGKEPIKLIINIFSNIFKLILFNKFSGYNQLFNMYLFINDLNYPNSDLSLFKAYNIFRLDSSLFAKFFEDFLDKEFRYYRILNDSKVLLYTLTQVKKILDENNKNDMKIKAIENAFVNCFKSPCKSLFIITHQSFKLYKIKEVISKLSSLNSEGIKMEDTVYINSNINNINSQAIENKIFNDKDFKKHFIKDIGYVASKTVTKNDLQELLINYNLVKEDNNDLEDFGNVLKKLIYDRKQLVTLFSKILIKILRKTKNQILYENLLTKIINTDDIFRIKNKEYLQLLTGNRKSIKKTYRDSDSYSTSSYNSFDNNQLLVMKEIKFIKDSSRETGFKVNIIKQLLINLNNIYHYKKMSFLINLIFPNNNDVNNNLNINNDNNIYCLNNFTKFQISLLNEFSVNSEGGVFLKKHKNFYKNYLCLNNNKDYVEKENKKFNEDNEICEKKFLFFNINKYFSDLFYFLDESINVKNYKISTTIIYELIFSLKELFLFNDNDLIKLVELLNDEMFMSLLCSSKQLIDVYTLLFMNYNYLLNYSNDYYLGDLNNQKNNSLFKKINDLDNCYKIQILNHLFFLVKNKLNPENYFSEKNEIIKLIISITFYLNSLNDDINIKKGNEYINKININNSSKIISDFIDILYELYMINQQESNIKNAYVDIYILFCLFNIKDILNVFINNNLIIRSIILAMIIGWNKFKSIIISCLSMFISKDISSKFESYKKEFLKKQSKDNNTINPIDQENNYLLEYLSDVTVFYLLENLNLNMIYENSNKQNGNYLFKKIKEIFIKEKDYNTRQSLFKQMCKYLLLYKHLNKNNLQKDFKDLFENYYPKKAKIILSPREIFCLFNEDESGNLCNILSINSVGICKFTFNVNLSISSNMNMTEQKKTLTDLLINKGKKNISDDDINNNNYDYNYNQNALITTNERYMIFYSLINLSVTDIKKYYNIPLHKKQNKLDDENLKNKIIYEITNLANMELIPSIKINIYFIRDDSIDTNNEFSNNFFKFLSLIGHVSNIDKENKIIYMDYIDSFMKLKFTIKMLNINICSQNKNSESKICADIHEDNKFNILWVENPYMDLDKFNNIFNSNPQFTNMFLISPLSENYIIIRNKKFKIDNKLENLFLNEIIFNMESFSSIRYFINNLIFLSNLIYFDSNDLCFDDKTQQHIEKQNQTMATLFYKRDYIINKYITCFFIETKSKVNAKNQQIKTKKEISFDNIGKIIDIQKNNK